MTILAAVSGIRRERFAGCELRMRCGRNRNGETKSGRERIVPVSLTVLDLIWSHISNRKSGYVVCTGDGTLRTA